MNALVLNQGQPGIIEQFLTTFISTNTRNSYASDLKAFFQFTGPFGNPTDLKGFHITAFRDKLSATGASTATINRKISSIKSLVRWLIQNGYMTNDPTISVKVPKVVRVRPTAAFNDEDVRKLLKNVQDVTHKTVVMTLFYTGLRRSELISIKTSDLLVQNGFNGIRVIGKGGKERTVAIPEQLMKQLNTYLASVEVGDKLFDMDSSTVYRVVKRYAARAEIEGRFGAHSCRATVISNLLDNQVPLRDVANLAGHSSVNTTMLYDKKRKGLEDNAGFKIKY